MRVIEESASRIVLEHGGPRLVFPYLIGGLLVIAALFGVDRALDGGPLAAPMALWLLIAVVVVGSAARLWGVRLEADRKTGEVRYEGRYLFRADRRSAPLAAVAGLPAPGFAGKHRTLAVRRPDGRLEHWPLCPRHDPLTDFAALDRLAAFLAKSPAYCSAEI